MCGICGELRFDSAAPDRNVLRRMVDKLANRGPDDSGHYFSGVVALGHRRLSIIDLSARARQPMVDADTHLSIVFNGSIYNYPSLRETLIGLGHRFNSKGDTEVILKAYAQWGEDCVSKLTGMFAFAIWDPRQQCLFLARDRIGIKPLYYSITSEFVRFASTPQALLVAGDIDTRLDTVALHHQFTLHGVVPAPRTVLRGVRKVKPAHTLSLYANGKSVEKHYWQLSARRPAESVDESEWMERLRDALVTAVRRRLEVADVPVGVLLSGGLDSSLLVSLLAKTGIDKIKTFTVGFDDQPEEKGSEFEYSDLVVQEFGTDHHKFFIRNGEIIPRVGNAVSSMSEPMFGQDAVAFYLLAEQVSREVKVVQSGQGADEVFAGYFWYSDMHQAQGEARLPRFANRYFDREHGEWQQLIDRRYHCDEDVSTALIAEKLDRMDADEYLDRVLALDASLLIVDDPVKRLDNMTMAWGLEARVPFLDHELIELAAQMPPEFKLREGGKYPLKKLAHGLLPKAIIDRPKGYFPVPALKYVRGPFFDFMHDIVNSRAARDRGLYQRAYIDRLLASPDQHLTRLQGSKLWHTALFELWMQINIDPVAPVSAR